MIDIKKFVFNPFGVNAYILSDETGECLIIDPGCFSKSEQEELVNYLTLSKLQPVGLVNTHFHLDHILGNSFILQNYGLKPLCHPKSEYFWTHGGIFGSSFGLEIENMIIPETFVNEGDLVRFGNSSLEVLYTPGHADGSISLVSREEKFVITGDVLFNSSIGRTDLATGNLDLLLDSIKNKLFGLPDDYRVLPGHGPETTISHEKMNNPFIDF